MLILGQFQPELELESGAKVVVPEPCMDYNVEVSCKMHNSGHWSDWSEPHSSVIKNSLGKYPIRPLSLILNTLLEQKSGVSG